MEERNIYSIFPTPIYISKLGRKLTASELRFVEKNKKKESERASKRASERAGGRVGPEITSRKRLRAVSEQASVDVSPIVRG